MAFSTWFLRPKIEGLLHFWQSGQKQINSSFTPGTDHTQSQLEKPFKSLESLRRFSMVLRQRRKEKRFLRKNLEPATCQLSSQPSNQWMQELTLPQEKNRDRKSTRLN